MFEGFILMNSVFAVCEQLGKFPHEVVEMATSDFCALIIWNSAKNLYQSNLRKINK